MYEDTYRVHEDTYAHRMGTQALLQLAMRTRMLSIRVAMRTRMLSIRGMRTHALLQLAAKKLTYVVLLLILRRFVYV